MPVPCNAFMSTVCYDARLLYLPLFISTRRLNLPALKPTISSTIPVRLDPISVHPVSSSIGQDCFRKRTCAAFKRTFWRSLSKGVKLTLQRETGQNYWSTVLHLIGQNVSMPQAQATCSARFDCVIRTILGIRFTYWYLLPAGHIHYLFLWLYRAVTIFDCLIAV